MKPAIALLFALSACTPAEDDTDVVGGTDADTDLGSDVDTDADSDTDADTDTDAEAPALYEQSFDTLANGRLSASGWTVFGSGEEVGPWDPDTPSLGKMLRWSGLSTDPGFVADVDLGIVIEEGVTYTLSALFFTVEDAEAACIMELVALGHPPFADLVAQRDAMTPRSVAFTAGSAEAGAGLEISLRCETPAPNDGTPAAYGTAFIDEIRVD